jgi:cytoskeletal protein RodZ
VSIGPTLAAARQARGLSVDDVSQATRIRATVIRAIEHDEFAPCGGSVYARGHIRSIANVVGTDPAPLIEEFDEVHGTAPAPITAPLVDPDAEAVSERRRPHWMIAAGVALVLICVAALANLLTTKPPHNRPVAAPAASPSAAAPSPSHAPSPAAKVKKPPPEALAYAGQVSVLVRITGDKCWLSVAGSAGQTLFQQVLQHGQSQVFHDQHELRLVLGNSGAVDLVVNGHDLGAPGAQGAVTHLAYGPGDPTAARG